MFKDRLEFLSKDIGAMHMVNIKRSNGQVHLFLVHIRFEPQVIYMLKYLLHGAVEVSVYQKGEDGCEGECDGEGECGVVLDKGGKCEGEGEVEIHHIGSCICCC